VANIFRGPFPNFLEGGGDSRGGDNPRLLLLLRLQSGVEHRIGPLYIHSLRYSFHHLLYWIVYQQTISIYDAIGIVIIVAGVVLIAFGGQEHDV